MNRWNAAFIAAKREGGAAPLLRQSIALDRGHGAVTRASLVFSALGVVEATINGVPASPDLLTPGWSSFEWRLRYSEVDVTSLVRDDVVLGLALGNGWYRGRLGWGEGASPYGGELAGFAELRVRFSDGYEQLIVTDNTWKSAPGDVTADSLYDGQSIDARRTSAGWNLPGFDDSEWDAVRVIDADEIDRLEPYIGPPVRRQGEILPQNAWVSPDGKVLIDFGQNLVGWVRVTATGNAGDVITIKYAEVLEHDELGTRPLRAARATDRFTLSGEPHTFEPTFTFHGFRYIEIDGWPGGIDDIAHADFVAVVVSSDLQRIGRFQTSDPLLNRLHENVVWGMRGNFLDVPTDCPQRDERLGWTGDIAVFAPSAAFLFDAETFLLDWLRDVELEQRHHDGVVPFVVPDVLKYMENATPFTPFNSTAIWSDAVAWVPWALWQAYGRIEILEKTFEPVAIHARHVRALLSENGIWDAGFQFGDWLDPDAPADRADEAKADRGVVATASIYRTAKIAAEMAALLGRDDEHFEFTAMAEALHAAFHDVYVDDRRILSDCTTVYSLAIVFGLLDDEQREWAGARLAELVVESGFHISTGFAGTPYITDALTTTGYVDIAYRLLLQQDCPSWLYPVTMGATTIWERWDSMLPDGTINPGDMTSFNHYALGAVADWLHRVVGGLAPLEPGYSRILIEPRPGGGLEWAETSLETRYGLARVRWEIKRSELIVDVDVPQGATALLRLPGYPDRELKSGSHRFIGSSTQQ